MRNVKKLLLAIVLAFLVGTPVCAGDMSSPPYTPPPPPITNQAANPEEPCDSQGSVASDGLIDPTLVIFDLLYSMLSIY
jgi:hypothetical protein